MHRYEVDRTPAMRPVRQAARRDRRRSVRAALLVVIGAGCVLYWAARYWASPEHRIEEFAASSRRGDVGGMFSLVGAGESRRLGLTPAKLQAMLADAAGEPGGVVLDDIQWEPLNERQRLYNRWARVTVRGRGGAAQRGSRSGALTAIVQAYDSDAGWKIGASNLVAAILVARTGSAFRGGGYAALCRRHGVPAETYDPSSGGWEQAPSGR